MTISNTNKLLGWGIVIAALTVFVRRVWLMELDNFEFDDAFMFIRYAENIVSGNGYTWNPGDAPLFGCTSILYTYFIAFLLTIMKGVEASKVLVSAGLIFSVAFLIQLQLGLFNLLKSKFLKNRLTIAITTIPFLVFPLVFGFHSSTGMETTLSLFLNAAFIFAVLHFTNRKIPKLVSAIIPGIIGWMLYLTRPDNALVLVLFPFIYIGLQKKWKHLVRFTVILLLMLLADTIIKWQVFGEILPLSFYAKKSGFTEGYTAKYFWNPVKYLALFISYMMPYILVLFAFVKRKHIADLTAFLLPILLTFAYYFSFDQIMGFEARLYFPFMPYIVILTFKVMDDGLSSSKKSRQKLWAANTLIFKFCLLLLFLFFTVYSKYRFINMYESWARAKGNEDAIEIEDLLPRKYNRETSIKKIDELLHEFPDDFVFAATEHGYISGNNPQKRILDLSGLHQAHIAKYGYDDEILATERPDLIWMPHQDLTVLHHKVRNGSYFKENYEYISNVYAFGCAIRLESNYYDELKQKIH